jgi:hypothetical protein
VAAQRSRDDIHFGARNFNAAKSMSLKNMACPRLVATTLVHGSRQFGMKATNYLKNNNVSLLKRQL